MHRWWPRRVICPLDESVRNDISFQMSRRRRIPIPENWVVVIIIFWSYMRNGSGVRGRFCPRTRKVQRLAGTDILTSAHPEMVLLGFWLDCRRRAPDGLAVRAAALPSAAAPWSNRRRERRQGPKDVIYGRA